MAFEKGNKLAGDRTGVKNKRTVQWEAFADYCLLGGLDKFQKELDKLKGKDFILAFTSLLEFHKPKQQRVETDINIKDRGVNVNMNIVSKKLGA